MTNRPPPLVSIVTPSYNCGGYIEETILSIKSQTYPYIEHIVVDGASTDNTVEILRRHGDGLTWVSEPDKGQSDAINKGWRMCRGDILAYLNADDLYTLDAVETAVNYLLAHPDVGMVYGGCNIIDEAGQVTEVIWNEEFDLVRLMCSNMIPQQTVFFRREVLERAGFLDTSLHLAMDYDFFIRAGLCTQVKLIPKCMASFRICPGTKTHTYKDHFYPEHFVILDKIFAAFDLPQYLLKKRAHIYAQQHKYAGQRYLVDGNRTKALDHLVQAISIDRRDVRLYMHWLAARFAPGPYRGILRTRIVLELRSAWHKMTRRGQ